MPFAEIQLLIAAGVVETIPAIAAVADLVRAADRSVPEVVREIATSRDLLFQSGNELHNRSFFELKGQREEAHSWREESREFMAEMRREFKAYWRSRMVTVTQFEVSLPFFILYTLLRAKLTIYSAQSPLPPPKDLCLGALVPL